MDISYEAWGSGGGRRPAAWRRWPPGGRAAGWFGGPGLLVPGRLGLLGAWSLLSRRGPGLGPAFPLGGPWLGPPGRRASLAVWPSWGPLVSGSASGPFWARAAWLPGRPGRLALLGPLAPGSAARPCLLPPARLFVACWGFARSACALGVWVGAGGGPGGRPGLPWLGLGRPGVLGRPACWASAGAPGVPALSRALAWVRPVWPGPGLVGRPVLSGWASWGLPVFWSGSGLGSGPPVLVWAGASWGPWLLAWLLGLVSACLPACLLLAGAPSAPPASWTRGLGRAAVLAGSWVWPVPGALPAWVWFWSVSCPRLRGQLRSGPTPMSSWTSREPWTTIRISTTASAATGRPLSLCSSLLSVSLPGHAVQVAVASRGGYGYTGLGEPGRPRPGRPGWAAGPIRMG